MSRGFLVALLLSLAVAACNRGSKSQPPVADKQEGGSTMAMIIQSSAFGEGSRIPKKYSCDGEDVSPPLSWSGVPKGTVSLALICDDPDAPAGLWVHWVLWGLSPEADSLPEHVTLTTELPGGARQGLNSWRRLGYGGPCPPPGNPHRYYFKLYALDAAINPPPGTPDKLALEQAMEGHVLDVAQVMGRYGR